MTLFDRIWRKKPATVEAPYQNPPAWTHTPKATGGSGSPSTAEVAYAAWELRERTQSRVNEASWGVVTYRVTTTDAKEHLVREMVQGGLSKNAVQILWRGEPVSTMHASKKGQRLKEQILRDAVEKGLDVGGTFYTPSAIIKITELEFTLKDNGESARDIKIENVTNPLEAETESP